VTHFRGTETKVDPASIDIDVPMPGLGGPSPGDNPFGPAPADKPFGGPEAPPDFGAPPKP
jgi:hypothetical protein